MNVIFDVGMATGPVLGYVHQYFLIKMQKSIGTFSIDICGILLFANVLRLNFYIFNQYELALFFQSLIMITAQIFLIQICTKFWHKKSEVSIQSGNRSVHSYEGQQEDEKFWRWSEFSKYIIFFAVFSFCSFSLSIICKKMQLDSYGVLVGLIALLSESMLILPQILQNYRSKSTKGLSRILVVLNLSGDILKLIYFLIKSQAFQFVMCGIIQVILDSFVVIQIVYYGRLEQQKFQKENKSLVVEKKDTDTIKTKMESEQNFEQIIQMKSISQLSPEQPEDNQGLQESYPQNNQEFQQNQNNFQQIQTTQDPNDDQNDKKQPLDRQTQSSQKIQTF